MSPFHKPNRSDVAQRRWRILISGEPGTGKSTSLLTFPRPLAVINLPGEKGGDTIPDNDPTILRFDWNASDKDSHTVLRETEEVILAVASWKYGKVHSMFCEGLHKYFDYLLDSVSDGAYFRGEDLFERTTGRSTPNYYGMAYRMFNDFISRTMLTNLPIAGFTAWVESEADRKAKPGEKSTDIPTHIMPMLPGKEAKLIMGEFSVCLGQHLRKLNASDPKEQGVWQTKRYGEYWNATIKAPPEISEKIPVFIPASYDSLLKAWGTANPPGEQQQETAAFKGQQQQEKGKP